MLVYEKKQNTFLKIHGHTAPQLRHHEASPEPTKEAARRAPQRPQRTGTGSTRVPAMWYTVKDELSVQAEWLSHAHHLLFITIGIHTT